MDELIQSFEDRKGLLLVWFIGLIFAIVLIITGVKVKTKSKSSGIILMLLGIILSLIMLVLMYVTFILGMNF